MNGNPKETRLKATELFQEHLRQPYFSIVFPTFTVCSRYLLMLCTLLYYILYNSISFSFSCHRHVGRTSFTHQVLFRLKFFCMSWMKGSESIVFDIQIKSILFWYSRWVEWDGKLLHISSDTLKEFQIISLFLSWKRMRVFLLLGAQLRNDLLFFKFLHVNVLTNVGAEWYKAHYQNVKNTIVSTTVLRRML